MVLSTPLLVVSLAIGLAFQGFISIAIIDRFHEFRLMPKGK